MFVPGVSGSPAGEVTPQRLQHVCGALPSNACKWALEQTGNEVVAKVADFVGSRLLHVLLIWVFAVLLNRVVRLLIRRVAGRIAGAAASGSIQRVRDKAPSGLLATGEVGLRSAARANTTAAVLRSVATFVIYGLAVIYSLAALGLQVTPLIAGAGVAGVALAFGAQSMVRDFLTGIVMLVEDQYGVGDVIDVGGVVGGAPGISGTVEAVTLRSTRVRDVSGTVWHIPNGEIRRVGNKSQGWARALLDVPLPLSVDVSEASTLIRSVAAQVCHDADFAGSVLGEPELWGVEDLTLEAVTVRLVIKTRPGEQWQVMRALRAAIKEAFDDSGIELAAPPAAAAVEPRTDRDGPHGGSLPSGA